MNTPVPSPLDERSAVHPAAGPGPGDAAEVARHTLEELRRVVPRIASVFTQSSERLLRGEVKEGLAGVAQAADAWGWTLEALARGVGALGVDLAGVEVEGESAASFQAEAAEALEQVVGALEVGDMVLVSDLVEYELVPRVETMGGLLEAVLASAR